MFTLNRVKEALEQAKTDPITSRNAQDYAALIIIHDHLCMRKEEHGDKWEREDEKTDAKKPFDKEMAMKWVNALKSEDKDHPTGPRWTPEDVQPIAEKLGIAKTSEEFWMFFAVMNALYSDNYEIAKKYNLAQNDMFFADLADAWLDDADAVKDKAWAYYKYIMRH